MVGTQGVESMAEGGDPAHCLPAIEDEIGGVVIDVLSLSPTDDAAFGERLHLSLELWRSQKRDVVWLKLPTKYSRFADPAIQEGFGYHHADNGIRELVLDLHRERKCRDSRATLLHGFPLQGAAVDSVRFDKIFQNLLDRVSGTLPAIGDYGFARPGDSRPVAEAIHEQIHQTNLLRASLRIDGRWAHVGDSISCYLRNAQKKVKSLQCGSPGDMNSVLHILKCIGKLVLSGVLFEKIPAVGAIAPEAAASGSLQAGNSENTSNFVFGLVSAIGALFTIIAVVKTVKWRRRHARNAATSAPGGEKLNPASEMLPNYTVQRYRKMKYCFEVVEGQHEGVHSS